MAVQVEIEHYSAISTVLLHSKCCSTELSLRAEILHAT